MKEDNIAFIIGLIVLLGFVWLFVPTDEKRRNHVRDVDRKIEFEEVTAVYDE